MERTGVTVREKGRDWYVFANFNGQRKARKIGPGATGKKAADKLAAQWEAALVLARGGDDQAATKIFAARPVPVVRTASPKAGPTLAEVLPAWIDSREASGAIRAGSAMVYRSIVKTWITPHLGHLTARQVTRPQIGALIAKMAEAKRARTMVGHVTKILSSYFRSLLLADPPQIDSNPAADLRDYIRLHYSKKAKKASQAITRRDIFTADEITRIKQAAKVTDPRLYPFLEVAFSTGLRFGELCALRKDDIKAGKVHVEKAWSLNAHRLEDTKDSEPRDVPVSKELAAILKDWYQVRRAEGWGELELVFPHSANNHGYVVAFWHRWNRLLKRAKVAHKAFHATRHCFASYALLAGIRPELVQKWLGHSVLSLTLDVYRTFIPTHESDARDAEKLGDLVGC